MKAITIRPPWSQIIAETAALTALGVVPKTVENRGRPIADRHIGTTIAIHAGLTWCPVGGSDPRVRRAWRRFATAIALREVNQTLVAIGDTRTGYVSALKVPSLWIEQGAVVAVATLVDCHLAERGYHGTDQEPVSCCPPWGEPLRHGKPAYHLVFGHVRRLRNPVPCAGKLAVPWTLPDDVAAKVEQQTSVAHA